MTKIQSQSDRGGYPLKTAKCPPLVKRPSVRRTDDNLRTNPDILAKQMHCLSMKDRLSD